MREDGPDGLVLAPLFAAIYICMCVYIYMYMYVFTAHKGLQVLFWAEGPLSAVRTPLRNPWVGRRLFYQGSANPIYTLISV